MRAIILTALIALTAFPALAQTPRQFEWPQTDPHAIPDARLNCVIQSARDDAREAEGKARAGHGVAGQAERVTGLRIAIGRGPQPITVADGVVMKAVPWGDAEGAQLGTLTWTDGAVLTGAVSQSLGVFKPAPESSLKEFRGWMYFNDPATGVFEFKTGERFTGSYNAGTNASGVYESADGSRRFIGEIDFDGGSFLPVVGQVYDRSGKVIAVVRRPHS